MYGWDNRSAMSPTAVTTNERYQIPVPYILVMAPSVPKEIEETLNRALRRLEEHLRDFTKEMRTAWWRTREALGEARRRQHREASVRPELPLLGVQVQGYQHEYVRPLFKTRTCALASAYRARIN